ncbi:hypothetical protein [Zavarzinella formosa]|uniref:hypothetical protein n=1 Tax=Zavarzinella formosa TaxID=360055 RepID=UPI000305DB15|nr:hypothetical protein [Zavarzinella formosa]
MDAESNSFAVCIQASEKEDLEAWKVYRVIPDAKADEAKCLRVVDESGEDYLYPAARFLVLPLPDAMKEQLLAIAGGR